MRPLRLVPAILLVVVALAVTGRPAFTTPIASWQNATNASAPDTRKLEQQVRNALRAADPAAAEAALEELRHASPESRSFADLQAQVRQRRVAFDERAAVVAFLAGNYELAAQTLEHTRAAGPVPPRVIFYLACSRVALALTATSNRDAALDEARSLYLQATSTSGFSPNWRHISPSVRGVLEGRATQHAK